MIEQLDSTKINTLLIQLKEKQARNGCISLQDITDISQNNHVSISEIYGIITFYSFLRTKITGRHVIWVCRSLPCHMKDMEEIKQEITRILEINPGQTTKDGRFSYELTNCIGACDMAPAMIIDDELHGNLTKGKIPHILDSYK
jgi:NADH:ubiquinone oxidoreductase subunit E